MLKIKRPVGYQQNTGRSQFRQAVQFGDNPFQLHSDTIDGDVQALQLSTAYSH